MSKICKCESPRAPARSGSWPSVVEQQRACPRTATVESPRASARSEQWAPVVTQQWACQQSCPRSATEESPQAFARWYLSLHNNGHDNNPVLQRGCTCTGWVICRRPRAVRRRPRAVRYNNRRPNTDGEQYIKKFDDPAKSFKPQSDEEHEFYNRVLDVMCARFGKYPANLQDFKLNVTIWSKLTRDCLLASSWLAEDHNDFKRMATNKTFPSTQDLRVCATTNENTDRSQRRMQHANPARLEQISMVKNYVAWRSSSKTDQDESSRVRSSQSLGNKTGGRMERKRIFRKMLWQTEKWNSLDTYYQVLLPFRSRSIFRIT